MFTLQRTSWAFSMFLTDQEELATYNTIITIPTKCCDISSGAIFFCFFQCKKQHKPKATIEHPEGLLRAKERPTIVFIN